MYRPVTELALEGLGSLFISVRKRSQLNEKFEYFIPIYADFTLIWSIVRCNENNKILKCLLL